MRQAVCVLRQALEVAETNEPINRASGNVAQADLEAEVAGDIRDAIVVLENHK
jgi:hypothetical protein